MSDLAEVGAGVSDLAEVGAGVSDLAEVGAGVSDLAEVGAGVSDLAEVGAGVSPVYIVEGEGHPPAAEFSPEQPPYVQNCFYFPVHEKTIAVNFCIVKYSSSLKLL